MAEQSKYILSRDRFQPAEYYQNYFATVPQDTKPEDIEDPMFFSGVAGQCRACGQIRVLCEDGTWLADYFVTGVGPQFVMARLMQLYRFDTTEPSPAVADSGYIVKWAGHRYKYRVIRKADGAVVHSEEETQQGAQNWLDEHLKAVAR